MKSAIQVIQHAVMVAAKAAITTIGPIALVFGSALVALRLLISVFFGGTIPANAERLGVYNGIYGDTVEEKIWFALRDIGCEEIQAASALGNMYYEAGYEFNPYSVEWGYNEYNGGIGLCQWTNYPRESGEGRNTQLKAYATSKEVEWTDLNTQIEFAITEINNGVGPAEDFAETYEFSIVDGCYKSDWDKATTIEEAARIFCYGFERPNADDARNSLEERTTLAKKFYEQFQGREHPVRSYLATNLIDVALSVSDYIVQQDVTYSLSNLDYTLQGTWDNIGKNQNGKGICCATFVSLAMWKAGIVEASELQRYGIHSVAALNNYFKDHPNDWKKVSISELQTGDIVIKQNYEHIWIYIEKDKQFDEKYCVWWHDSNGNLQSPTKSYRQLYSDYMSQQICGYRYIGGAFDNAESNENDNSGYSIGSSGKTKVSGFELDTYKTSQGGKTYIQFHQNQGPWSTKTSSSGSTIASAGCCMTTISIIQSGFGVEHAPEWGRSSWSFDLKDKDKYFIQESGCGDNPKCNGKSLTGEQVLAIKQHLKGGLPVIVHVLGKNRNGNSAYTKNQHWMAIVDITPDGSQVYVIDPNAANGDKWKTFDSIFNSSLHCCGLVTGLRFSY